MWVGWKGSREWKKDIKVEVIKNVLDNWQEKAEEVSLSIGPLSGTM